MNSALISLDYELCMEAYITFDPSTVTITSDTQEVRHGAILVDY